MLLRRCAWHKQYRGYGKLLGVSSWRGRGMAFSDGMCADCAARLRVAWQLPARTRPAPRVGIPWATATVSVATAALIFGIAMGPVNRVTAPPATRAPSVVAAVTPPPAAPTAAERTRVAGRVVQRVSTATPRATTTFGPGDMRGITPTGSLSRSRIARVRGRDWAPAPDPVEPANVMPIQAEVDAEWSPTLLVAAASVPADEPPPPAALPHAVATFVDAQAP